MAYLRMQSHSLNDLFVKDISDGAVTSNILKRDERGQRESADSDAGIARHESVFQLENQSRRCRPFLHN